MLPIFAGELFGEKSYDKVLGIICSVNTAGYAVGIPLANLCYDIFGTYNIALYISAGLMLLATIIKQFVITESKKERLSLEA
jgi:MFS family permease